MASETYRQGGVKEDVDRTGVIHETIETRGTTEGSHEEEDDLRGSGRPVEPVRE